MADEHEHTHGDADENGKKNEKDDHGGHHAHMAADFRRRFWVSLALTLPILALSPLIREFVGLEGTAFRGNAYVMFALSSAVFFYGGSPFLKGMVKELSEANPGMMTLIAVTSGAATLGAWLLAGREFDFSLERAVTVRDESVNAWAMPGGKMAVYTGILPIAGGESGLETVMGHEVAHAVARHGNERTSQGLLSQLGGLTLSAALAQNSALTREQIKSYLPEALQYYRPK